MRTPNSEMNTGLRKGTWSHEEDEMLISYISRYGIWNWSQMPRFAGLARSGKSCRLRWMNYLKPNLKRGNFSKEEDEIILQSHSILGNKWSIIASKLPGRTDNEIKNHWHAHLKKRKVHNMNLETTKQDQDQDQDQNRTNTPLNFQHDNINDIKQPDDHNNPIFESCFTFDQDDIFSSSSTTTSTYQEIDVIHDYNYDTGSPGTVDDIQCFWDQLFPLENFDLGTSHLDMFSYQI